MQQFIGKPLKERAIERRRIRRENIIKMNVKTLCDTANISVGPR
jgi:hypothetical protein